MIVLNLHHFNFSGEFNDLKNMKEESKPMLNFYSTFINPPLPGLSQTKTHVKMSNSQATIPLIEALFMFTSASFLAMNEQVQFPFLMDNAINIYELLLELSNMEKYLKNDTEE